MVPLIALGVVYFVGFGLTGFVLTLWVGDECTQQEILYAALVWPHTWLILFLY